MKKDKKKFDYNIVTIGLCFLMILFGLGLWGTKGLFVVPITSALGISRSVYSIADTMRYTATAIVNIFFGYLVNKFGSKKLICAGLLALTSAAILYAVADRVFVFYIGGFLVGVDEYDDRGVRSAQSVQEQPWHGDGVCFSGKRHRWCDCSASDYAYFG